MAGESGRTNTGLIEVLLKRPYEFNFFQAVRLLSYLYPRRRGVGQDGLPNEEIVRFHAYNSLEFPSSSIREISAGDDDPAEEHSKVPQMTICFMGLAGRQGVLPLHYTEFLIERRFQHDTTAEDFFDIFLHRLASFFYCAWEKHSITVQYEQQLLDLPDQPTLSQYVLDLIGLGSARLREGVGDLDRQALVFYSGLLGQHPRSAVALEGLLRDYFQVPVRITQFHGRWFPLAKLEQTDMKISGLPNLLGDGAALGDAVWNPQASVRLHIGPLSRMQFEDFLPGGPGRSGGKALPALISWARLFLDRNVDFDIQLSLAKAEVLESYLWAEWDTGIRPYPKTGPHSPPALGLSSWLKTSDFDRDAEDVILSSKSASHSEVVQ